MSGPPRYDPSLDLDSGDLSVASSMASLQLGPVVTSQSTLRDSRRDISSPTPRRGGPDRRLLDSRDNDVDFPPKAGPSRTHSAHPTSPPSQPQPYPNGSARAPALERLGSQVQRSRSLNTRRQVPNLFTDTSAKSPLSATDRIGYSRRPGDPRPPPLITPEVARRVGRWVKEVVVCNFDLERGPVVERRIIGRRWGPGEKENVAFSSFPDTSLFAEGSIMFSFKIRSIPPDPSTLALPEPPSPMPDQTSTMEQSMRNAAINPGRATLSPAPHARGRAVSDTGSKAGSGGGKAEEYRKWDERGREWLYGYVWFEQRKDVGIARGYMQKSLVILTHLPLPSLFMAVLQTVAPIFFEHGYSALEAACHAIASWPEPKPDTTLDLPLLSDLLTVKMPDSTEAPQPRKVASVRPDAPKVVMASLPHSSPLRAFATILPSLWSIWECLILAEPILIIAPDPQRCSEIVWWLRDLIRPIIPPGDFRPYLHIHDHDFSLLVNSNKPQAGVVVGVTNPFFRNAASHWPNVIAIPTDRPRRTPAGATTTKHVLDGPEGFISQRHRSVSKDRPLLKRLEAIVAEGDLDNPEANEALRMHFQQLTERFLVPLNRYFQTLIPTPSSTSLQSSSPAIKPFSLPSFLAHLRSTGPNPLAFKTKGLTMKSRVEHDFYASFGMSPTFAGWLSGRIESLGSAVKAQSVSSSHNSSTIRATTGLFRQPLGDSSGLSDSERTQSERLSSEAGSSVTGWRNSDEPPRRDTLVPGDVFGPRRGSQG